VAVAFSPRYPATVLENFDTSLATLESAAELEVEFGIARPSPPLRAAVPATQTSAGAALPASSSATPPAIMTTPARIATSSVCFGIAPPPLSLAPFDA
jgi:hypothetical protein